LNLRSEEFVDDYLERVEKRCFFLLCGKTPLESAITVDLQFNILEDPGLKKKIVLNVTIDQLLIEYGNDITKNLMKLILQYRHILSYGDLYRCPKGRKKGKYPLYKLIAFQIPFYVVRKLVLKKA
jgi:CRISPR/Cas system-associated endonuclease Cas1